VSEVKLADRARCFRRAHCACAVARSGETQRVAFRRVGMLTAVVASVLITPLGRGLQPTRNTSVGGVAIEQNHHASKKKSAPTSAAGKAKDVVPDKNAYDFTLPGADGKDVPLSSFKGKYILIVNLGRKSAYAEQLPALIKLQETYKDKGLVVIGVPSDQFGASEPGTQTVIQKAYADAKVDFPVMAVSKVAGEDELPLYAYLTTSKNAPPGGPVHWNYTKFIVDKNGDVIARLDPDVAPDSAEMRATIDQVLDGTYKPKKADTKPGAKAAEDDDSDD
jgi:glutathione peroxidase